MSTHEGEGRRLAGAGAARPARRPRKTELVQRQARALGDPTRYDIFRYVADAPSPVRVATLADYFGVNRNAIRQHLAKLCDARLLVEELGTPSTTGRPPLQYRVAPGAVGTWGAPSPYELLATLLLDVATGTRTPVEAGAWAGRQLATADRVASDPLHVLEAEMARRGFEPRREQGPGCIELVLERCPFEAVAATSPEIVCEVHRGLAIGVLEATDTDLRVTNLVPYDPQRAGCRLQMAAGTGAEPSEESA